ncbi:MAG: hypothetical protein OIF51_04620 [Cellvibrionaceae bacterium]|nr:hypothetical protein [Cellvibrionaceae bacterium]
MTYTKAIFCSFLAVVSSCSLFNSPTSQASPTSDFNAHINRMLPPASSDQSDSISFILRAELEAIELWLTKENNPALSLVIGDTKDNCMIFEGDSYVKEIASKLKKDFFLATGLDEKKFLDRKSRDRMFGAVASATVIQAKKICHSEIQLTAPNPSLYNSLITEYGSILTGILEVELLIERASIQLDSKRLITDAIQEEISFSEFKKLSADVKAVVSGLDTIGFTSSQSDNLGRLADVLRRYEGVIGLQEDVSRIVDNLEQANAIAVTLEKLESTANDPNLSLDTKLSEFESVASPYLGKSERKTARLAVRIAEYDAGNLGEDELVGHALAIYKSDLDEDVLRALDLGNQIYKIVENDNIDFSQLDGNTVSAAAPVISSIAKSAFNISEGSKDAKLLNAAVGLGVAYFTGNPVAAMGALSSISGAGGGQSQDQAQFQALMGKLNLMDKKLDKLLEGQEKILSKLDAIGDRVKVVEEKIDVLQNTVEQARADLVNIGYEIMDTISAHSVMNQSRNECWLKYKDISDLSSSTTQGVESWSLGVRLNSKERAPVTLPVISFDSSNEYNANLYLNWWNSCKAYTDQIYSTLFIKNSPRLLHSNSYLEGPDNKSRNYLQFKKDFEVLSSPVKCSKDTIRCASSDGYISAVEQKVISVLARQPKVPRSIKLLLDDPILKVFVKPSGSNKVRLSKWLTDPSNLNDKIDSDLLVFIVMNLLDQYEYSSRSDNVSIKQQSSLIEKRSGDYEKYIWLAILQEEILSGSFYSEIMNFRFDTDQLSDEDFGLLDRNYGLARRFVLDRFKACDTPTGNACLTDMSLLLQSGLEYSMGEGFPKGGIESIKATREGITLTIDEKKIRVAAPTYRDFDGELTPISLRSIHLRAAKRSLQDSTFK